MVLPEVTEQERDVILAALWKYCNGKPHTHVTNAVPDSIVHAAKQDIAFDLHQRFL